MIVLRGAVEAFWKAFGAGMALRLAGLAALMAWSARRPGSAQQALLLSYVFGVLFFLLFEYKEIKPGAPGD